MKRMLCIVLALIQALSLCGCSLILRSHTLAELDTKAYSTMINSLFAALDAKNADKVADLFSPAVREQNPNLNAQIATLLTIYTEPTDEIGWDGLVSSSGRVENFKKSNSAYSTFPVHCGNAYYWFYIELMYLNDFDSKQIGITQLDFFTADEHCIFRYNETPHTNCVGIRIFNEQTLENEIRCINGIPHKYTTETKALDIEDVQEFLKTSNKFNEFTDRFGKPNAELFFTYYELTQTGNKTRYLEICVDNNNIHSVGIVDDFHYIEAVYSYEK